MSKKDPGDDLRTWTLLAAVIGFVIVYIVGFMFAWGEGMTDLETINPSRATARDFIIAFFPLIYIL